jgi:hypothetical protein
MTRLVSGIFAIVLLWLPISSCNSLKKGEMAKITCEYHGCFGSGKSTIIIFQKGKALFANLNSEDDNKTVKIEASDLNKFRAIISNLEELKTSGGCTSSKKYIVHTNSKNFVRKDEGCQQTGFELFEKEIFKEKL